MNKQTLNLNIRENFICLGSECPRDCCHGWDKIEVDEKTIARWSDTQKLETKQLLMSYIDTMVDIGPVIKTTKDKVCIALNDEKLCKLQIQFGHEYLSENCRYFPRISFNNCYRTYNSMSLSCPEVVEKSLFGDKNDPLFSVLETNEQASNNNDKLLYALDVFLDVILEKSEYPIGNTLYFISDVFVDIYKMAQTGELTHDIINQIQDNVNTYLSDISKSVKHGRLTSNPVTSGSFWKTIYKYCEDRNISKVFLDEDSSKLFQSLKQCDDSFAGYSKIYAVIKHYRKKANKQIKHQYILPIRKYIKIMFINKGFPLAPKHSLDLALVDCMINICALQLLMWIEVNKNGKLTDDFVKECIVEVDRKIVSCDGVIKALEENPHMIQLDKYCNSFLDLF